MHCVCVLARTANRIACRDSIADWLGDGCAPEGRTQSPHQLHTEAPCHNGYHKPSPHRGAAWESTATLCLTASFPTDRCHIRLIHSATRSATKPVASRCWMVSARRSRSQLAHCVAASHSRPPSDDGRQIDLRESGHPHPKHLTRPVRINSPVKASVLGGTATVNYPVPPSSFQAH
jgi:hypothetical protein